MLKKVILSALAVISLSTILPAYADEDMSCMVQFAVASPPIQQDANVAFNVNNDNGFSKSITLRAGSEPQVIERLPCSAVPLTISATLYSTSSNTLALGPIIGKCALKAGPILLNGSDNSVSVVFPYDFICDN